MSHRSLGIGLITYNRLAALKGCVDAVRRYTASPYVLTVADDGSDDGSVEWAREQGLVVITGERRGCAWNKNRALYYLLERTACDPILLLEDDTWPAEPGWEQPWIEAACRLGHVNLAPPEQDILSGTGTALDPYRSPNYAGSCTVSQRSALAPVGYLDTRFRGYGCEHGEWTDRFQRLWAERWGPPENTYPSLSAGLRWVPFGSWVDTADIERNRRVRQEIHTESTWRPPWRSPEEEALVHHEQAAAPDPPASADPGSP